MPPTVEQLASCMKWAAANDLKEMVLNIGMSRITILRAGAQGPVEPPPLRVITTAPHQDQVEIAAPLAGLCYLAPEPGSPPFVNLGDRVAAGQTLCIIEAMKVMTPVTATNAGTVATILVENGDTVPAGTALMRITP
ncbi:MAG: acetyl-CoA carboxylase biotin carboxyl carrier protein subunit [Paracoccus sp. (in: a-proteobacteria)]|nr:acetyl-CoA carboxylase biotin carboxyl carrier protein subunit [Paracoccus sp. (in: a-proteobacteria)]